MSTPLQRKLIREFKAIRAEGRRDCTVNLSANDLTRWDAAIFPAEQTDWAGAVLHLEIRFPAQYPHAAPDVRFDGTIPFHPNVYSNGKICLDLLQHNWSAAYGIDSVITSIHTLLQNPNPDSPANNTAAELFVNDYEEYKRHVRKCCQATWT